MEHVTIFSPPRSTTSATKLLTSQSNRTIVQSNTHHHTILKHATHTPSPSRNQTSPTTQSPLGVFIHGSLAFGSLYRPQALCEMEPIRDELSDTIIRAEESANDTDQSLLPDPRPQQTSEPPPPQPPLLLLPLPLPQAHVIALTGSFLSPSFSPIFYSTTSSLIPLFLLRVLAYLSGSFGDIYLAEARRLTLAIIPFARQVDVTEITQRFVTYGLRADTDLFEVLYERSSLFRSTDPVKLGFAYIARSLPFTFESLPSSTPTPIPSTPPQQSPASSPLTTPPTVSAPPSLGPLPPSSTPLPTPTTPPTVPVTRPPPINLPSSPTSISRLAPSVTTSSTQKTRTTGTSKSTTENDEQTVAKATLANSDATAAMLIILLRKSVLIWDFSGEAPSLAWEITKEQVNLYTVSSVSFRKSAFMLPKVERFEGGFVEVGVVPVGIRLDYGARDVDPVVERERSGVVMVVNRILFTAF